MSMENFTKGMRAVATLWDELGAHDLRAAQR
jgi:hypothetical protein